MLSPQEFTADLPAQYKQTHKDLAKALRHCINDDDASKIRSMMTDCGLVAVVVERYYDRSYSNPRRLSMVQIGTMKIKGYQENSFEEKIARAIDEGLDVLEVFGV